MKLKLLNNSNWISRDLTSHSYREVSWKGKVMLNSKYTDSQKNKRRKRQTAVNPLSDYYAGTSITIKRRRAYIGSAKPDT